MLVIRIVLLTKRIFSLLAIISASVVLYGFSSFFQSAEARSACATQANLQPNEVITRITKDTGCTGNQRWTINTVSSTGTGTETVCENSPVPNGFIIESWSPTDVSFCYRSQFQDYKSFTIKRPRDSGQSFACRDTVKVPNLPEDFVVSAVSSDTPTSCNNKNRLTIEKVSSLSTTFANICYGIGLQESRVPNGFVVPNDNVFSSGCGSFGRIQIKVPEDRDYICEQYTGGVPDGFALIGSQVGGCESGNRIRIGIPSNGDVICGSLGSPLPTGFIRTSYQSSSSCSRGFGYIASSTAGINTSGQWMCDTTGTFVPNGFVVLEVRNRNGCSQSGSQRQWLIAPPTGNPQTICNQAGVPVPNNYAVIETGTSSLCGSIPSTYRIEPYRENQYYCNTNATTSTLPQNWVVKNTDTNGSCPAPGTRVQVGPPNPDGETQICGNFILNVTTDLPTGYVVTGVDSDSSCGQTTGSRWTIQRPLLDSDTIICSNSPYPADTHGLIRSDLTSTRCSGLIGDAAKLIRPGDFDGPLNICFGSDAIDGYVITANLSNYDGCAYDLGLRTEPLDPSGDPQRVCANSNIYDRYILQIFDNDTTCGANSKPYLIGFPDESGTTNVCLTPPAPDSGYVITNTISSSPLCGGQILYEIRPIGGSFPEPFIDDYNNVIPGQVPAVNYGCDDTLNNSSVATSQPRNRCGS